MSIILKPCAHYSPSKNSNKLLTISRRKKKRIVWPVKTPSGMKSGSTDDCPNIKDPCLSIAAVSVTAVDWTIVYQRPVERFRQWRFHASSDFYCCLSAGNDSGLRYWMGAFLGSIVLLFQSSVTCILGFFTASLVVGQGKVVVLS